MRGNILKPPRASRKRIKVLSDEEIEALLNGPDHVLVNTVITAQILDTTQNTLEVFRCRGASPLPYMKRGRMVRYKIGDIRNYLNSCMRPQ